MTIGPNDWQPVDTWHQVPNIDHPALSVTVRNRTNLNGHILVRFLRRNSQLRQTAAWLPSGQWDTSRWHPTGSRLVPPAALAIVEAWLKERAG